MYATYLIFLAITLTTRLTLALPTSESSKSDIFNKRDVPSYCVPTAKADLYNSYTSYDESDTCAVASSCKFACVTFVQSPGSIGCPNDMTYEDFQDLLSAVAQQAIKDGWREETDVGRFIVNWDLDVSVLTTALANRNVLLQWDHAILGLRDQVKAGTLKQFFPSNIYLLSDVGSIVVRPNC